MEKNINSVYSSVGMLLYGAFLASFFSWHLGLAGAVLVPLAVVGVVFLVYEKEFTYPAAGTAMVLSGALLFCICLFVSLAAQMLQQTWIFPAMMFAGNACIVMGLVGTIVLGSVYMAAEEPNFTPRPSSRATQHHPGATTPNRKEGGVFVYIARIKGPWYSLIYGKRSTRRSASR